MINTALSPSVKSNSKLSISLLSWPKRLFWFSKQTDNHRGREAISKNNYRVQNSKLFALTANILLAFCIGCSSQTHDTPIAPTPAQDGVTQGQQNLTQAQEDLRLKLMQNVEYAVENGFTGSVLAIVDGTEILVSSHGLANRNNNTPITETTAFDVGAIAMEFTAAAIFKLQDQGLLDLSDTIGSILPDVPTDKADITLQHILRHGAGFAESHSSAGIFEPMNRLEARQRIFNQSLEFEPGSGFLKSESGYTLLADVVEEVSQREFSEFMRTELFVPAGLEHTGFYGDDQWVPGETAIGYNAQTFEDNDPANWPFSWATVGNGGLVTSVRDFDRWLTSISSGKVLSSTTFDVFNAQRWDHISEGPQPFGNEEATVYFSESDFGQMTVSGDSLGNKTRFLVFSNATDSVEPLIALIRSLVRTTFNPTPEGGWTVPMAYQHAVDNGFSGSVLVSHRGEILLDSAAGFANRAEEIPFTTDTVSSMGSITKQYTGALIMALQEAGLLSVEDRLSDHFADVPQDKAVITIHQLLTHTAGIGDDLGGDYEPIGRDEYLQLFWAAPLATQPGSEHSYSNVGYSIAAIIAEQVTGQSYEVALNERLFAPAGMVETGYLLPDWSARSIAVGYDGTDRLPDFGSNWDGDGPTWHLRGNGGLLTTTGDFLKWHNALANETVLSVSSVEALQASHADEGGGFSFYGYGWVTEDTPAGPLRWHDGGNGFHFANILRFVDEDLVVIMLANEENQASAQLTWQLARAALPALANWISPNE